MFILRKTFYYGVVKIPYYQQCNEEIMGSLQKIMSWQINLLYVGKRENVFVEI
jgi:hypothetical protein